MCELKCASSDWNSLVDVAGVGAGEAEEDEGGIEAEREVVSFVLEESWAARREEISSRMLGLPDAGFRADVLLSAFANECKAFSPVRGFDLSSAFLAVASMLSSILRPRSGHISWTSQKVARPVSLTNGLASVSSFFSICDSRGKPAFGVASMASLYALPCVSISVLK